MKNMHSHFADKVHVNVSHYILYCPHNILLYKNDILVHTSLYICVTVYMFTCILLCKNDIQVNTCIYLYVTVHTRISHLILPHTMLYSLIPSYGMRQYETQVWRPALVPGCILRHIMQHTVSFHSIPTHTILSSLMPLC
jgi:hypothetical protein